MSSAHFEQSPSRPPNDVCGKWFTELCTQRTQNQEYAVQLFALRGRLNRRQPWPSLYVSLYTNFIYKDVRKKDLYCEERFKWTILSDWSLLYWEMDDEGSQERTEWDRSINVLLISILMVTYLPMINQATNYWLQYFLSCVVFYEYWQPPSSRIIYILFSDMSKYRSKLNLYFIFKN